jgi:hypothetical protein
MTLRWQRIGLQSRPRAYNRIRTMRPALCGQFDVYVHNFEELGRSSSAACGGPTKRRANYTGAVVFGRAAHGSTGEGKKYARDGLFMGAELLIVSRQFLGEPRFDLIEVLCEFHIGCEEGAQPHEGSHDENVDLD